MINNLKYYLIIIISIIIVYGSNINNDLVYCDDHNIILVGKERIDELSDIKSEFFKGYINTTYYRPIINISFIIDKHFSNDGFKIYQISNIIYHIIATLLLFQLFLILKFDKIWSFLITMIFALIPINVNAVSWIVGRNDMIYSIFALISLIILLKKQNYLAYALSSFFTLLSFLSKETALLTPVINIIFAYFYLRLEKKEISKYLIFILISYLIYFLLKSNAELGVEINKYGLDIIINNMQVIPELIAKIFIPIDLMPLATYGTLNTSLGLILIIIFSFLILKFKLYKNILFILGVIIFILITSPAMLVTVSNSNDWNEYLECRAYLPTMGILLSILSIISKYKFKKNYGIIFIIIYILFAITSYNESKYYTDRFTFYERLIEKDSSKALFSFMLSRHYRSIENYEKEEEFLLKAYQGNKEYYKYPMNLGIYYFRHNYFTNSFKYFDVAVELSPDNSDLIYNYSNALLKTNKYIETKELIESYKSNNILNNELKLNYINCLLRLSYINEAINLLDDNLISNHKKELFTMFFYIGEEYFNKNKFQDSEKLLLKSIEIDDTYLEPFIALLNIYIKTNNKTKAQQTANIIKENGGRLPESVKSYLSE